MYLLIIEDSPRLRRALCDGFVNSGYAVDSSGDGEEALRMALSGQYDVIVLDIMLPTRDGLSVLREIRVHQVKSSVIILSAKDEVESRVIGLDLGADDYLCKPFSFGELEARVRNQIRKQHGLTSTSIDLGGALIDFSRREVIVSGETLDLTPSEYTIFETLALSKGGLVTYESLEKRLERGDNLVSRNAIEAHISALRKKLRHSGVEGMVKNRRGFGYYVDNEAS